MTDRLSAYLAKLRVRLNACRSDDDVTDVVRTAGVGELVDSDRVTPDEREAIRQLIAEYRERMRVRASSSAALDYGDFS